MPKIETPAPEGYGKVSLSSFANGGLEELFQIALQRVLGDVQDVNTKPDAKRAIDIKIVFEPNEERRAVVASCAVSEKLAGARGVGTLIFTGDLKRDGKFVATEHNPRQMRLAEADVAEAGKLAERPADTEGRA